MNRTQFWAILNVLVLAVTIFWNYYTNTGQISETTVGELSDKYSTLFTPAGYAFAIWGIIYLGLIYQSIYTLYCAFKKSKRDDFISKGIPWVILANVANCSWLWFWFNEDLLMSMIILFAITLFLMIAVIKLNMERWDADVDYIAGVWWPIDIYVGWVTVASIANTAIYLKHIGFDAGLSEVSWTVIIIIVAGLLNLFMVISRNMREFAVVGIWAIAAIAVRHWDEIAAIQWTAVTVCVILFIAINIHAYQNRATLPHIKLREKREDSK